MTVSYCRISDDPFAGVLCCGLEQVMGVPLADLDRGITNTIFTASESGFRPVRVPGQPNSIVTAPEVYQWLYERAPRLIDPRMGESQSVYEGFAEAVRTLVAALPGSRFECGTVPQQQVLAQRIFLCMTESPSRGGLGLQFDSEGSGTRTLADTYRDRRANCLEFVNFYLVAARIAGIEAVPLERFRDGTGSELHVAVGLLDPVTGQIGTIIDLEGSRFGPPRNDEIWSEISGRELLAYYYNARGIRNPDPIRGEQEIDLALRLNPGNYLLLFNKACLAVQRGALEEGRDLLLESAAAFPGYGPAYYNLNAVALRLQDDALAGWAWRHYTDLSSLP